jgi:tetratricopeptide (TPR) repeat protein
MKGGLAKEVISFDRGLRATYVLDKTCPALARSIRIEMVHQEVRNTQTLDEAHNRLAALEAGPIDALAAQAYIATREGNEDAAMQAIEALYDLPLAYPTADLVALDRYMFERRWNDALHVVTNAQARWPDILLLVNMRAKIYHHMGRPDMALAVYDEAERLCRFDSERKACFRRRALTYEKLGDFTKANSEHARVLEKYADDEDTKISYYNNKLRGGLTQRIDLHHAAILLFKKDLQEDIRTARKLIIQKNEATEKKIILFLKYLNIYPNESYLNIVKIIKENRRSSKKITQMCNSYLNNI